MNTARQLGIDHAMGEYSIYVDSDDWIENDMLSEMYNKAVSDEADLVIADFFCDSTLKKDVYEHQVIPVLQSSDVLKQILDYSIYGCLWNKLIRTKLFRKYNARFVPGLDYGEDVLLLCQLLQHPLRISKIDKAFYHYKNDNDTSLTHHYDFFTYESRKVYVDALMKLLPPRLYGYARKAAFYIVSEAFNKGVVRVNDLRSFYPMSCIDLVRLKIAKSVKVAFICALFHLDSFAKYLAKRYNRGKRTVDIG